MLFIIVLLVFNIPAASHWLTLILMIWIIVITVYSGVDYFLKNRTLLAEK